MKQRIEFDMPEVRALSEQFDEKAPALDEARKRGNGEDREPASAGVMIGDFYAYMPMHNYLFAPSRETWPASSVNARIPPIPLVDQEGAPLIDDNGKQKIMKANLWLDQNQPVEQMTWAPGEPMMIRDRLIAHSGWIKRKGVSCFNLYRPPSRR